MTESSKKLDDALKGSSIKQLVQGDEFQKLVERTRFKPFEIPKHHFQLPKVDVFRAPNQKDINAYQSAGVLVKRLAQTVSQWREQISEDSQPVVLALLPGGVQINVTLLAEESFHGLRIEGTIEGTPCMLLTHQASVQLLCYVAKVENEAARRSIGFIIEGQESQA